MSPCSDVRSLLEEHSSLTIVVHSHADMDALGSAIGLRNSFDGPARIVAPEGVQERAQRLPDQFGVQLYDPSGVDVTEADCTVVVDAPSSERITPFPIHDAAGDVIVVDHHEPGDLAEVATASYVDTDTGATATLVTNVVEGLRGPIEPSAAVALTAGLLDDTGSLADASRADFETFATLVDGAGYRVAELPDLLERDQSFSKRVTGTKAVVRSRGYRADRTLVLTTTVGGEQTAAAHALRAAGADVALVFSDRRPQTWVVGRANSDAVHLPEDLFTPLVDEYGGGGGGHAGAGTAKLDTSEIDDVRESAVAHLEKALPTYRALSTILRVANAGTECRTAERSHRPRQTVCATVVAGASSDR